MNWNDNNNQARYITTSGSSNVQHYIHKWTTRHRSYNNIIIIIYLSTRKWLWLKAFVAFVVLSQLVSGGKKNAAPRSFIMHQQGEQKWSDRQQRVCTTNNTGTVLQGWLVTPLLKLESSFLTKVPSKPNGQKVSRVWEMY